jgi:hypothetical protein
MTIKQNRQNINEMRSKMAIPSTRVFSLRGEIKVTQMDVSPKLVRPFIAPLCVHTLFGDQYADNTPPICQHVHPEPCPYLYLNSAMSRLSSSIRIIVSSK